MCCIQKAQLRGISNLPIIRIILHSHYDESTGFDYYNKRLAIEHVFETIYRHAEPNCSTKSTLYRELLIGSAGSRISVMKVSLNILETEIYNVKHNAILGVSRRSRKKLINEGSEEGVVV